jgi:hypothetical protein
MAQVDVPAILLAIDKDSSLAINTNSTTMVGSSKLQDSLSDYDPNVREKAISCAR